MKSTLLKLAIAVPMLIGSISVMAAGSVQHSSAASAHSVQALAQASVAGVKVATGMVAIPLMITGTIGQASGQAGDAMWDAATTPIGEPLTITDDLMTSRMSPEQAMQAGGAE